MELLYSGDAVTEISQLISGYMYKDPVTAVWHCTICNKTHRVKKNIGRMLLIKARTKISKLSVGLFVKYFGKRVVNLF